MIGSSLHLFICTPFALLASASQNGRHTRDTDLLDWVNPLIGSQSGGNVFAGATLPYGMAKGSMRSKKLTQFQG
jgi:putative alpha-1,2-mannosidase